MRHATRLLATLVLIASFALLASCRSQDPGVANTNGEASGSNSERLGSSIRVPSGTVIGVTLETRLSSETSGVGAPWTGVVRSAHLVDGHAVIPAGSPVAGTVTQSVPAAKGSRAVLDLRLTELTVNGHTYHVHANTDAVVAGSPRARNLGAIAGSAAAGALVGHSVAGDRHGTLIGGLVGGLGATAVVAHSKGWQVVLKPGTALTFTTTEMVALRH